jgi:tetratricopeptide (TPR) repeat protein
MPDAPIATLEAPARRLVEKAQTALARGHHDYVAAVCAEVLDAAPGCLEVRRLQREAQLQAAVSRGRWLDAWNDFWAGARLRLTMPREPAARIRAAQRVLARRPNQRTAWRQLALAATALDFPETAVYGWQHLRALQPDDAGVGLGLAAAWLAAGRPRDALMVAEKVRQQHPHHAAALALMRQAAVAETVQRGHWDQAGDYRGKLRHETAAPVGAAGEATAAPPPSVVPSAAAGSVTVPDSRGALAQAKERVQRQPQDAEARLALAAAYLEAGDTGGAIASYQAAQRNPRTRAAAGAGLGRVFQHRRMWDLAVTQFVEAKQALPARHELRKEVLYQLGVSLEALGRAEEAMREYKELYREDAGYRDVAHRISANYAHVPQDQRADAAPIIAAPPPTLTPPSNPG